MLAMAASRTTHLKSNIVIRYRYLNFNSYIYKVTLLRTCRLIGAPHDTNQHGTSVSFLIDARAFERAVRGSDFYVSRLFVFSECLSKHRASNL